MIKLALERIGFASPRSERQDVDDYFIVTISNEGKVDINLEHFLKFGLTDSNNNQPICAADDLCDINVDPPGLYFEKSSNPGQDMVWVQARGLLRPNTARTIGIKLIRRGLIDDIDGQLQYGDPLFLGTFEDLNLAEISVKYTVVFPINADAEIQCFQVRAPHSQFATGRTATWELSPHQDEWQRIRAVLISGGLPIAAALDRCICGLLACKAESAANPRADIRRRIAEIAQTLKDEEAHWEGTSFDGINKMLSDVVIANRSDRNELIRLALDELYGIYKNCAKSRLRPSTTKDIIKAQELLERGIIDLRTQHSSKLPIPDRFHESLQILLMFVQSLRKVPYDWSKDCSERAFQDRLHQFLSDTQSPVEREVVTGPGRVDFLLINTPVELKAIPLTGEPNKTAAQHGQQAADYASLRGSGIGILLILDTQKRSPIKAHRPHLPDETNVGVFTSVPSLGGTSNTIVVTLSIMAFPPAASSLKTPIKALGVK